MLDRCDAVILDLDGVVTDTASLHRQAWKELFDDYLQARSARDGRSYPPFDATDYVELVDGKPRHEGTRSFLASRGISLPEGGADAEPTEESIAGLGRRKDAIFKRLLSEQGVRVFPDAVEQLERWRRRGLKLALVSASKNAGRVLEAAGLAELFDLVLDGQAAERQGLSGKPAPDAFLHAAQALGVEPSRAAVIEDALAGVEAGRRGQFAAVIGVARHGGAGRLREAGAHRVVRGLDELEPGDDVVHG